MQSLQRARQLLAEGKPEPAAAQAREALVFLQIQERGRVNEAKAVLAEALERLKDYPTALRYYQELAAADAPLYQEPYARLCLQLAGAKLEVAGRHLALSRKGGQSFERTNQLLEAQEALGQARELIAAAGDRAAQAQANRLAGELARARQSILPGARKAPTDRRRLDPFGGKAAVAQARKPLFTRPWSPPLPVRGAGLELTDFVITPGLLGVSRVRGQVRNRGPRALFVEVRLRMLSEDTYRYLLAEHPEQVADERVLARRASLIVYRLPGALAPGAVRQFEEKVESGLPVDVHVIPYL